MSSIRKRNGKWQVRINRDDISVAKTFLNKKDGETWARLTEAAIERNEFTPQTKDATETLGQVFDQYNKEVAPLHRSKTTSFMLASLKGKLGDVRIDLFNARDLAEWRDKRLKEVKAASVLRELNTLSAVLNHARKEWCYQINNPVSDIKRPTVGASRTRRLVDSEEMQLIAALPNVYRNILRFALATAMRRGEVLSLLWCNVNLEIGVAVLPMTKNGEMRRVPLSKEANPTPFAQFDLLISKAYNSCLIQKNVFKEAIPKEFKSDFLETPSNITRVKSALASIDPNCDRSIWRDICFAIHSLEWKCSKDLAQKWSMGELL